MSRNSPHRRNQRGFTLIEIVIAFAILAVGLDLAMQIATSALRQTRQAAEQTQAALNAQSVLDIAGVGQRLKEGSESGEFEDRSRWELEVAPIEMPMSPKSPVETGASPIQLYRLQLTVRWGDPARERSAVFSTLRALTPDPNGGG